MCMRMRRQFLSVQVLVAGSCRPGAAPLPSCAPAGRQASKQTLQIVFCRFYSEVFPASGSKDAALLDMCSR